jgi:hypothetical protein
MAEEYPTDHMTYIVSLSGGVGSAMAAERALQRYGDRVKLWFSDVRHEDEDLYRFMQDTARRWWQLYGVRLHIHRNERNPLMVAEQKVIIPNERRAPCSHELKIMPFRRYIAQLPKPLTIMLGMDWKEQHRLEAPRKAYEALGYQVDYPLMWKPWELRPYQDVIRQEWGIEPPRLYAMGFPHNNCGGRCIKQGVKEWLRLRYHFPERFEAMKQWELAQRAKGGARATHAICSEERNKVRYPLTLEEIERRLLEGRYARQMQEIINGSEYKDDRVQCYCAYA